MPERRHERAANPVAFGTGCRAEAHTVEALLGKLRELVGSGGVFWVDATDAVEFSGILLEDRGEIAVVPAIVDDLNEDRSGDVVGLHEIEEGFGRGVFGWRVRSLREGECGV